MTTAAALASRRRTARPKERVYRVGCCCWCGKPVTPPRRSWCSERCVREYKSFEPAALREACYERDRGFCRLCHRDVGALEARIGKILRGFDHLDARGRAIASRRAKRWEKFLDLFNLRHLWEADHRIPVCEGGLNCLANLRTLCVPCHKKVTRRFRIHHSSKIDLTNIRAAAAKRRKLSPRKVAALQRLARLTGESPQKIGLRYAAKLGVCAATITRSMSAAITTN